MFEDGRPEVISVSQLMGEINNVEQSLSEDKTMALEIVKASHELTLIAEQNFYLKQITKMMQRQEQRQNRSGY